MGKSLPFDEPSLFALHVRALASRWPSSFLHDARAMELADRLPPPRDEPTACELALTMLRTAILDRWVEDFLEREPKGAVIELGAALSTRFDRLDNGSAHWFAIDSPENIAAHLVLLPPCRRRTIVAARELGGAFDSIACAPGPYLFLAEGRLDALDADTIAKVVRELGERFPGAHLACDVRADVCSVLATVATMRGALHTADAPIELVRRLPLRARLAYLWSRERLRCPVLALLRLGAPS